MSKANLKHHYNINYKIEKYYKKKINMKEEEKINKKRLTILLEED